MKKLLAAALMLCLLLGMSTVAMAEERTVATAEELLQTVRQNSNAGDVIKLSADITWFATKNNDPNVFDLYVLDISERVLDLNGHTITAENFTLAFEGSNFTIRNGTFDANGGSYALFIGDEGTTDNAVIENISLNGGINVYNATNVALKNVKAVGTQYYAIWCDENGHVTVESGSFSTNGKAVLGLTTIASELDISGGEYSSGGKPLVLENGNSSGKPVINAGIFDTAEAEKYVADENLAVATIGTETYAVGNKSIEEAIIKDPTKEVTITKGNATLNNLPEGTKVKNEGGTVTVNGETVAPGEMVTVQAAPVPPAQKPVYRDTVTIEIGGEKSETGEENKTETNPNTGAPLLVGAAACVSVFALGGMVLSKKK